MATESSIPKTTARDAAIEEIRKSVKERIKTDAPIAFRKGIPISKILERSDQLDAALESGNFQEVQKLMSGGNSGSQSGLGVLGKLLSGISINNKQDPIQEQIRSLQLQQLVQGQQQGSQNQELISQLLGQSRTGRAPAEASGGGLVTKSANISDTSQGVTLENIDFDTEKELFKEKAKENKSMESMKVLFTEMFKSSEQAFPGTSESRLSQKIGATAEGFKIATGIGNVRPLSSAQDRNVELKTRDLLKATGDTRPSDRDVVQLSKIFKQRDLTSVERIALLDDTLRNKIAQNGRDPNDASLAIAQSFGISLKELENLKVSPDVDREKVSKIREKIGIVSDPVSQLGLDPNKFEIVRE